MKRAQAERKLLHTENVDTREVAHENAGDGNGQQQEECEIVGEKREVAQGGIAKAPDQQPGQCDEQNHVREIEWRHADLEIAVEALESVDECRHRLEEQAQMAEED